MILKLWENYSIFFGEAAAIVIESSLLHLLLSTFLHDVILLSHSTPPQKKKIVRSISFPSTALGIASKNRWTI